MFNLLTTILAQANPGNLPSTPTYEVTQVASETTKSISSIEIIFFGLFFIVSLLLIILVMGNPNKDDGIGGLMGGGGAEQSNTGKKTAEDAVTQMTNAVAVTFIVMAIIGSFWFR